MALTFAKSSNVWHSQYRQCFLHCVESLSGKVRLLETASVTFRVKNSSEQGNQLSFYSLILQAPILPTLCFSPSLAALPQVYTKVADESAHTFPDQSTKSHVNTELIQLCGDALPRYQHNPKQNVMHFTAMPHQLNVPLPAHCRTHSCAYAHASTDGHRGAQEVLKLWPAQHTLFPAAGARVSTTWPQHLHPQSRWGCAHPTHMSSKKGVAAGPPGSLGQ